MKYTLELLDGVFQNRTSAIAALDLYRWHRRGQPIIAIYMQGENYKALFAIGVKSSDLGAPVCGLNCYVLMGDGMTVVNNIETMPIDYETLIQNSSDQICVNMAALYAPGDGIEFIQQNPNDTVHIIQTRIDGDTIYFDNGVMHARQNTTAYYSGAATDIDGSNHINVLVDGTTIEINGNNELHVIGGGGGSEYTAGDGIEIDPYNTISAAVDDDTIYINENGQLSAELMERITWRDLKILRDNSRLVPGKQYRIIDYTCETTQENTRSAHHDFDIIVFADSENQLNENARAIQREDLDINALTLPFSYEVPYFQTNKKGVIYYFTGYYIYHGTVDPTVYGWRRCNIDNVSDSIITNDWGYPAFVYTYTSNPSGYVYKDYNNGTLSNQVDNVEVIYNTITEVPKIDILRNTSDGYNPTSLRAYYAGATEEINGTTFYRFNWLSYNYEEINQTYLPGPDDTCVLNYIMDNLTPYDLYMLSNTPTTIDNCWLYMPDAYENMLELPPQQRVVFETMGWFNPNYTNLINLKYMQEMYMVTFGYYNDVPSSLQPTNYTDLPTGTVTCNYEFINGQTHIESSDYFTNSKLESWRLKYCLDNNQHRFLWASPETIEKDDKWYTMGVYFWEYEEIGQVTHGGKSEKYNIKMKFNPFDFVSINGDIYMRWRIADWGGNLPGVPQDSSIYTPYDPYYWDFTSPQNGLFDSQRGILIYDGGNYVDIYDYCVTQEGYSFSDQNASTSMSQDLWQFDYIGDDSQTGWPIYSCNGIGIMTRGSNYDGYWAMNLTDLVTGNDNLYQFIESYKGSGNDELYNKVEYGEEHLYIPEGKGVVYYMQDEWNNEAPYDFKSIKYGIGAIKKETIYKCPIYQFTQTCDIYTGEYGDKPGTLTFNKQCVSIFPPVMIDGRMYLVFQPDSSIILSGFGSDITISIPNNSLYVPYPYDFINDLDGILSQSMMFVYDGQMITFETYLAQYLVQYGLTYTSGSVRTINRTSGSTNIELYTIEDGVTVTIDDVEYEAFYINGDPNNPYIFINGDGELCLYNDYNQASELLTIPHYWDTGDKLSIYDKYDYYIEYSDKGPRTYVYTFNNDIYGVNIDHSLGYMIQENWMSLCFENIIKEYHNDQLEPWVKYIMDAEPYNFSLQVLNKNVFLNIDFNGILPILAGAIDPENAGGYFKELNDLLCIGNKLEFNCHDNIFGSNCVMNIMGGNCNGNVLNNYCKINTFGNNCSFNILHDSCSQNNFDCECLNNILYVDSDCNTFGQVCNGNKLGNNCTLNTFGQGCGSNALGNSCTHNTFGQVCNGNTLGNDCTHNTFGQGCGSNTLGNSCTHNTFGQGCGSNNLESCVANTFGQECSGNELHNGCQHNTFGQNCSDNILDDECTHNTFGQSCSDNIMGYKLDNLKCVGNILGNTCQRNIFRDTYYSLIGDFCFDNVFEKGFSTNVLENNIQQCVFGYNANINLDPTVYDASNYAYMQNMHISSGVYKCYVTSSDLSWSNINKLQNCQIMPGTQHPSTGTMLNIEFPVAGTSYTQIAGYNSSNVLTYKNPMD